MQQSTKQQLLELVCFYNSCNKPDETMLEKMYYQQSVSENINTWKYESFCLKKFVLNGLWQEFNNFNYKFLQ